MTNPNANIIGYTQQGQPISGSGASARHEAYLTRNRMANEALTRQTAKDKRIAKLENQVSKLQKLHGKK